MNILVFDAEANGFLDVADTVWCVCMQDWYTRDCYSYGPNMIEAALDKLSQADVIIGHNIRRYDLPLFEKVYGWTYSGQVIDTLVTSRVLWPDRPLPRNTLLQNGVYNTYNPSVYGWAHSLGAWGWRLGHLKPQHEDWSRYSPEMLVRCKEDTAINVEMLEYLLEREAHEELESLLTTGETA